MIRWICGVKPHDEISLDLLCARHGIQEVTAVIRYILVMATTTSTTLGSANLSHRQVGSVSGLVDSRERWWRLLSCHYNQVLYCLWKIQEALANLDIQAHIPHSSWEGV